jgi:hypothetical protein
MLIPVAAKILLSFGKNMVSMWDQRFSGSVKITVFWNGTLWILVDGTNVSAAIIVRGTEDGGRWPLLLRRVKDCCRPSLFNPLRTVRLNYINVNFSSHTEHIPLSLRKQPVSVYENDRCFVVVGIQNTVTCMGNIQNFIILQLVLIRQSLDFKWLKNQDIITIVVALRTGQWRSWFHFLQEQHVFFFSMGSTHTLM